MRDEHASLSKSTQFLLQLEDSKDPGEGSGQAPLKDREARGIALPEHGAAVGLQRQASGLSPRLP